MKAKLLGGALMSMDTRMVLVNRSAHRVVKIDEARWRHRKMTDHDTVRGLAIQRIDPIRM
jgi:hypothetical protein